MPLIWNNPRDLDRITKQAYDNYVTVAVDKLKSIGDEVLTFAREKKGYTNRTANLINSIGYMVLQDNNILFERFDGNATGLEDGGDVQMARNKGREYAEQIARGLAPGAIYLVWVAGMHYAVYVQAKGFDVLEGSGNWVATSARSIINDFKEKLKRLNNRI